MREHTRKLPIKEEKYASTVDTETPMSMDEALRKLLNGAPQGAVVLKGLRTRENLTQAKLGELLGIAQTNISQMERGTRAIGKDLAKRFAKFFKTDYRFFL